MPHTKEVVNENENDYGGIRFGQTVLCNSPTLYIIIIYANWVIKEETTVL